MRELRVLTGREASIFACLTDTVVAPEPVLPPVRETDAVASFDAWLVRSPRLNRVALRALLYAVELGPRLAGFGRRLRGLGEEERARLLDAAEHARAAPLRQAVKLVEGLAFLSYYGDDRVMVGLGYDANANLSRARELRTREGRP
jgi:hypothetical protein